MFDRLFGQCPTITCGCGNKMQFPDGYYPENVICQNCGQIIPVLELFRQQGINFPNEDLTLSYNEMLEIRKKKESKKKLKESLKVIECGKVKKGRKSKKDKKQQTEGK